MKVFIKKEVVKDGLPKKADTYIVFKENCLIACRTFFSLEYNRFEGYDVTHWLEETDLSELQEVKELEEENKKLKMELNDWQEGLIISAENLELKGEISELKQQEVVFPNDNDINKALLIRTYCGGKLTEQMSTENLLNETLFVRSSDSLEVRKFKRSELYRLFLKEKNKSEK